MVVVVVGGGDGWWWWWDSNYSNYTSKCAYLLTCRRHGVVVSTLDFESRSPSSNLGGASRFFFVVIGCISSHKFHLAG